MLETSRATVRATGNALQVKAGSRGFEITFDEPEESGGANSGMNPVEGLLCALGACQTIAAMIFAGIQDVKVGAVWSEVEGDLDSDGFLGKNPEVRNGFQEIRCTLHISGEDAEAVRNIAELAEERCPVGDCLKNPVPVSCKIVVD